jgi:hypothetical protein
MATIKTGTAKRQGVARAYEVDQLTRDEIAQLLDGETVRIRRRWWDGTDTSGPAKDESFDLTPDAMIEHVNAMLNTRAQNATAPKVSIQAIRQKLLGAVCTRFVSEPAELARFALRINNAGMGVLEMIAEELGVDIA